MADEKKYLDLVGLTHYDEKIKAKIAADDATTLQAAKDYTDGKIGTLDSGVATVAAAILAEKNRAEGVEGTLASLTTDEKSSLVAAINEIDAHADANAAAIGTAKDGETAGTGLIGRIEVLEGSMGAGGSVADQIKTEIEKLDKDDAAVAHEFVTAVSETDGVITVSRAALVADDIPSLTLAKISDKGTAASADVATVAIGSEGEATDALVTSAQVKAYVDGLDSATDGRLDKLEATHATNEDGTFQTVAEEAAAEVAKVVAEAPDAFDTLKEIADWIAKDGETGFDAANRIVALETKTAGLVVNEGSAETVANAIAKAVADEATRIDAITGTPDTGKTLQAEIDAVEAAIGTAKDGETPGTGLTGRIETIEASLTSADIFVPITINEIDALFAPAENGEENA